MHRFYASQIDEGRLSKDESHHALSVLRLKQGDALTVFDGRGREARASVTAAEKDTLRYRILTNHFSTTPGYKLRLGQAVPKSKAMEFVIQKCTELGLTEIFPLLSDRSVVQLVGEQSDSKLEKWNQTALEACKQCGQNYLPQIHAPQGVASFVEAQKAWGGLKLVASLQPEARPLRKVIAEARLAGSWPNVTLLVGPEGDFTPAEMGSFRSADYIPVSLGPTVLRTETAAIYTVGVLLYELQQ